VTEREILQIFAERYPASAMRSGGRPLRIRNWETLSPATFRSADALGRFLGSMEKLEQAGLLRIGWKKRLVGEVVVWAELVDADALYARLGWEAPDTILDRQRSRIRAALTTARLRGNEAAQVLLRTLDAHLDGFVPRLDEQSVADVEAVLYAAADQVAGMPIRALSIRLFRDSKRLERLLPLLRALAVKAETDPTRRDRLLARLPQRVYPELWLAGTLELVFDDGRVLPSRTGKPMAAFGLSLDAVVQLWSIRCPSASGAVLSVENKESFYALAASGLPFGAYVYCGGRPNRAVRRVLRLLAESGCALFHAGDLDPDGIAILGEVRAVCGAAPFGMDAAIFDRYLPYARPLDAAVLRRLAMITAETSAVPGIAALMARIAATGLGVEQEIIAYAETLSQSPSTPVLPA